MLNGGALLFDIKKIDEGYISEPRNPLIIKAFRNIKLAENLGLGLLSIKNDWNKSGFKSVEIESNLRKNHFMIDLSTIVVSAEKEEAQEKAHAEAQVEAHAETQVFLDSNKTAIEMLKIINENSPISRKKISDKLGYSSRTGNIKRAMNLLIKNELINLTIPKIHKSPNQKYVITDKGKALLKRLKKR